MTHRDHEALADLEHAEQQEARAGLHPQPDQPEADRRAVDQQWRDLGDRRP